MIARLRTLRRDERGVTVIEFAIITPVMMALLFGLSDLLYQGYAQSILEGAMVKAGRDSGLESNPGNTAALDDKVKNMVGLLGPKMTFASDRRSYAAFALVKPETFTDKNTNGIRDPGECYDDVNGNKRWDVDPGFASQGGANDVTKYTVTITYPRLFPAAQLFGWTERMTIKSSTLLKNQPYKSQTTTTVASICT